MQLNLCNHNFPFKSRSALIREREIEMIFFRNAGEMLEVHMRVEINEDVSRMLQ